MGNVGRYGQLLRALLTDQVAWIRDQRKPPRSTYDRARIEYLQRRP